MQTRVLMPAYEMRRRAILVRMLFTHVCSDYWYWWVWVCDSSQQRKAIYVRADDHVWKFVRARVSLSKYFVRGVQRPEARKCTLSPTYTDDLYNCSVFKPNIVYYLTEFEWRWRIFVKCILRYIVGVKATLNMSIVKTSSVYVNVFSAHWSLIAWVNACMHFPIRSRNIP